MPQPLRIACFGETLYDLLPAGKAPGGAPMNVALHLTRRGLQAHLISRVGQDALGDELLAYLQGQGLDTRFLQRDPHYPTGTVAVDMSDPTEVRYEIVQPVAWDHIHLPSSGRETLAQADALVFGSLALRQPVSAATLQALLDEAQGLKVFDINLRPPFVDWETIDRCLHAADLAKVNEHELASLGQRLGLPAGEADILRGLQARYGLRGLILTQGAAGAAWFAGETFVQQPGFAVKVADTIGSGDAFLAAFLSRYLRGEAPADCLHYACATGALVASYPGANPPISEGEIEEMMEGER
jgi:fructokinase